MPVFRFELRRLVSFTFWWSAAMAVFIYMMIPVYIAMIGSGTVDMTAMAGGGFFDMLGVDVSVITKPIGVYGFLNSFYSILAGICGMFLGLKAFTKETVGQTAEFTYTKPFKRGAVFLAKVLSALISVVIICAFYFAGSFFGGNSEGVSANFSVFALIASSFGLIELFFLLLGACVGALHPKIRTPLLASAAVVFLFYVLSAFAGKMNFYALKLLTPYSYFGASKIVNTGGYNREYIAAYCILCAVFAIVGYIGFIKKDVTFIA